MRQLNNPNKNITRSSNNYKTTYLHRLEQGLGLVAPSCSGTGAHKSSKSKYIWLNGRGSIIQNIKGFLQSWRFSPGAGIDSSIHQAYGWFRCARLFKYVFFVVETIVIQFQSFVRKAFATQFDNGSFQRFRSLDVIPIVGVNAAVVVVVVVVVAVAVAAAAAGYRISIVG